MCPRIRHVRLELAREGNWVWDGLERVARSEERV